MKRTVITVVAAAAALTLTAGHAQADTKRASKTAKLTGSKATCSLQTWPGGGLPNDHARLTCKVKDTKADGYVPYVVWRGDGYAATEFAFNRKGAGKSITASSTKANPDAGYETVYFKTCLTTPGWDRCSDEQHWNL
ncbi:hypothetical protein [Streptomyces nanshensis]|uniref:Ig-like domain-containing protein n=1 Tax=Streptomyces nanshensis TaxID=518642 RepID=A0A1E7L8Y9_9ACTN|nr:hypothetical protein [Streptomyces nanshensis]OEV12561.1 hypothetical protein AN218_07835 [Streptomyces nanshensis]